MTKKQGTVLVIDDDEGVLHTAKVILKPHFSAVKTFNSPHDLPDYLKRHHVDVLVLDMNFSRGVTSGQEGLAWLKKIRQTDPGLYILVNTAYGDIDIAVQAMKAGAVDFLTKPWEKEKLLSTVLSIFELSQSKKELNQLRNKAKILNQDLNRQFDNIIGHSEAMQHIFRAIDKIAGTDANVLILGENGTGKELIARAIHQRSTRHKESFIKVDLGAITESLFSSELFGHAKGAFTDAKESRAGRFEIASGGSLFLDEIGNTSAAMQAKLLTALQQREIVRVGSNKPVSIDIRLICATNRDIYEMVAKNTFRQDLLYRINTVEINLPPLRERKEDIPLLANHYLKLYAAKYQKERLQISRNTLDKLVAYQWPGNIRELQHAVERAIIMSNNHRLLPSDFLLKNPEAGRQRNLPDTLNIELLEKNAIETAIAMANGNLTKASEELGIGRTTLYRKMRRYGITI